MTKTAYALGENARTAIADALQQSLADTVVTTMLAQSFHWNVKGMSFGPLHTLFQEVYEDHFVGQDDLAERIRALSIHVDASLAGMVARSAVSEHGGPASDKEMIAMMQEAQEATARSLAVAGELAAGHGDSLTEDLCIARGQIHEKFAWMMRAHLG